MPATLTLPLIEILDGVYTQTSIDYFLKSKVKGSPLNSLFDDESYRSFQEEACEKLTFFVVSSGKLVIPISPVSWENALLYGEYVLKRSLEPG